MTTRIPMEPLSYVRPEIVQMAGYVPGEQPQAGKFIKLNTNENPYPPSPQVLRAITEAASSLSRYPDPLATAFRRRAAEILNVDPEWILCGNGSDDILTIVTRALVGQGQMVRLPYPSYILYRTLAQLQHSTSQEIHFNEDWTLPASFSRAEDGPRIVFLPNPNSPSGTVVSREAILEVADRLPCPLLVDEAYADFAEANCIDLVRQNSKIMVSRSLSKSYALAGLRFGFLVAHGDIIKQLQKVKDSYNCDALSIAGATAAINDQRWLSDRRAQIIATRRRLERQMTALGFDVAPSHANFVWCTHASHPVKSVYEKLKANQILVRYMDYPGWGDGLRISVGTDEQIDACLTMVQKSMAEKG
jgi:histidinol-phosphate aminotransferase